MTRPTRRAEPRRSIRCPYHAWTYDLAGTLVAASNMREVAGFACADYPLKPVAVAEWQGFVMVNLSQAPRPVEEWRAPLGDRLQACLRPIVACCSGWEPSRSSTA